MKVETALEHIRIWMDCKRVTQIIINKPPGQTGDCTLELKQQMREEEHLKAAKVPFSDL